MKLTHILLLTITVLIISNCKNQSKNNAEMNSSRSSAMKNTFKDDLELLESVQDIVLLKSDNDKALVAVCPAWQGRVMTSSLTGMDGQSLGWINHELIGSGRKDEHMNAFGGEDRFWLGPEGGQFSIYFEPGADFIFDNWHVPPEIDTEPFLLYETSDKMVSFRKNMNLLNYSNFEFDLRVDRTVELLEREKADELLGMSLNGLDFVAFESVNTITNTGDTEWTRDTGKLSIWILGMFQPSASTTVIIPVKKENVDGSLPQINDAYFGIIPDNRLKVEEDVIFFLADGRERGKIGIGPDIAKPFIGSYNEENNLLTLVNYSLDENAEDYVNSMWEIQEEPFAGDVVNSYNDGPLEDGDQLGPFYELETSSPAAGLKPDSSLTHIHTTIHLTGEKTKLDAISRSVLGVSLDRVRDAF